jgi:hypothetical protein
MANLCCFPTLPPIVFDNILLRSSFSSHTTEQYSFQTQSSTGQKVTKSIRHLHLLLLADDHCVSHETVIQGYYK